jgi:ABC-type transport system involved in multi-copper enzyme maturation permease subunit
MMRQTAAIFLDSYRELNSRKLFWVSIGISAFIVAIFACTGVNPQGISFLTWTIPLPQVGSLISPKFYYKFVFVNLGVGIWLSWISMALALLSTASIFPDFVANGSIELSLSKPIGRVRLFFTKYFAAMLFAALQVTVFTVASFLVIGIRGDSWEWRVFLAIPIVVLVFSYIFCICVLAGLRSKSTIFSLIAAGGFWLLIFIVHAGETAVLFGRSGLESRVNYQENKQIPRLIEAAKKNIQTQLAITDSSVQIPAYSDSAKAGNPTEQDLALANPFLATQQQNLEENKEWLKRAVLVHRIIFATKAILPKTTETTDLLNKYTISEEMAALRNAEPEQPAVSIQDDSTGGMNETREQRRQRQREIEADTQKRMEDNLQSRSLWYILGGSLAFEAVILGLCAWIFARRDF